MSQAAWNQVKSEGISPNNLFANKEGEDKESSADGSESSEEDEISKGITP